MTSSDLPTVVISRDGKRAVAVTELVRHDSNRVHERRILLKIETLPHEPPRSAALIVPGEYEIAYELEQIGLDPSNDSVVTSVALFGIGEALNAAELALAPPTERAASLVTSDYRQLSAYAMTHDQRLRGRVDADHPLVVATEEQAFAYVAAKVYWCWKFGYEQAPFTIIDDARLGRRAGDLLRIARREEGRYWRRVTSAAGDRLIGLPRLFDEVPAGTFPGLERSPILVVQDLLTPPRYEAASQAWAKATGFVAGDNPDPANAVKEAVAAVESVALIVGEKAKGTMGDAINALAAEGKIRKPLDKVFHRLWGFASNESGVRHLNAELPDLTPSEARLLVNWSAAALLHLLELDRKP